MSRARSTPKCFDTDDGRPLLAIAKRLLNDRFWVVAAGGQGGRSRPLAAIRRLRPASEKEVAVYKAPHLLNTLSR